MKIPTGSVQLKTFVRDTIDECKVSVRARREACRTWRRLYFSGQAGDEPPKYNKCFTHIERLGSYLYSAADVRLSLDFQSDDQDVWTAKSIAGARRVNRIWNRSKSGLAFSTALRTALIDGSCFIKLIWKNGMPRPFVIRNGFFGVLREDLNDLSEQDAFVHSYYLTKSAFRRLISDLPPGEQTEIMEKVSTQFAPAGQEVIEDSYFHQIVTGGTQPLSATAIPTGQIGQVEVFSPPQPMISPEVRADIIRIDELWVFNDKKGDFCTFRYVDPGIMLEGRYRLRSLSDIPGKHPFIKVCPNEDIGYFWGRSELANLFNIQGLLNRRINNVDRIFNLQASAPQAFVGFDDITEEKKRAMLMAGGQITSSNPNAKIQSLAPEMPPIAIPYLEKIEGWFDEMAGFTPALLGQADAGVRTSQQGNILLRTGSPPIRERAFTVECQVEEFANAELDMLRAKDATVLSTPDGQQQFTLDQLPNDASVMVDSHSSSPAFSGDNTNMAFALRKSGAIDNADLLENVPFPRSDQLAAKSRKREKAQAEFIQAHPEVLLKGKPGPKPGAARSA